MKLSPTQTKLLLAMANGRFLKSHRFLDGHKQYQLHAPDNTSLETVRRTTVTALYERGLIYSNQKFPAATYNLTPAGEQIVSQL